MALLLVSTSCMINGIGFWTGDSITYEGDAVDVYNFYLTRPARNGRPGIINQKVENRNNTLGLLVQKQANDKKRDSLLKKRP